MDRLKRPWRTIAIGFLAVLAAVLVYISVGSVGIPLSDIARDLMLGPGQTGSTSHLILWQVRLPRALACALSGGVLGCVGCVYQALLRNPLAEPYVLGVSSGAAVGGTIAILVGLDIGLVRIIAACLGGCLSLMFVVALARRQGAINMETLLLGGVVTSSLLAGWTTLNLWFAGQDTNRVLWWLLGSTTPMYWDRVATLAVVGAPIFVLLYMQSRKLTAVSVSETMAGTQGIDVNRTKWVVLTLTTVIVGVVVGCVGMIGFVGLVAPHLARRSVGPDLRFSLPMSVAYGTVLLLVADVLAQSLKPGTELPLGAITAALGAPLLLFVLWRRQHV